MKWTAMPAVLALMIVGASEGDNAWTERIIDSSMDGVLRFVFIGPTHGWAAGGISGVYRSADGGVSWERLSSNLADTSISGISFSSKLRGWAIGTVLKDRHAHARILKTLDGGGVWIVEKEFPERWELQDVFFLTEKLGWVVGASNTDGHEAVILCTQDGGATWTQQYRSGEHSPILRRIRFGNDRKGIAVGDGVILRTADGGSTWTAAFRSSAPWLNGLATTGTDEAWVVGGPGILLRSTDGGSTWTSWTMPEQAAATFFWSAATDQEGRLWICGAKGAVWVLQPERGAWRKVGTPTVDMLSDIALPAGSAIVAGDHGRVFRANRLSLLAPRK